MSIQWTKRWGVALLASTTLFAGCGGDERQVTVLYDQSTARVLVKLQNAGLTGSERVYIRARRGSYGKLDCAEVASAVEAASEVQDNVVYGPTIDTKLTESVYADPRWATNPTPEMIASLQNGTDSIIDVCIMDGSTTNYRIEQDLHKAWDNARATGLGGKADDPSGEVELHSVEEYAERCVAELGEIPFFPKTDEGKYETYDCLNSTPIPMTVTANGQVTHPDSTVAQCDNPQYIYSLCEPGPRVAQRTNDEGTRWVLLCRKSMGGYSSNRYNDIAMIGHNPYTGKTCFFQNALYNKTDGGKIPHPGDVEKSRTLWEGVQGGMGGTRNIECARCHGVKPFIHSPWIDGAKDPQGRSIVPRIGEDPDFPTGANDTPYSLVNQRGQGWELPKQATGPKVAACTRCHRVDGSGTWVQEWFSRLSGSDGAWNRIVTPEYLRPEHKFWMPPDSTFTSDADFATSTFASALKTLQRCRENPTDCGLRDVPSTVAGSLETGIKLRNPMPQLSDNEVATKAASLMGFGHQGGVTETRCGSCHTLTRSTLRQWQDLTVQAEQDCLRGADNNGQAVTDVKENLSLRKGDLRQLASYDVAAGTTVTVKLSSEADADLYVRKDREPTRENYDCRPFADGGNETCDGNNLTVVGPGTFYLAVYTDVSAAKATLTTTYTPAGQETMAVKDRIACFRKDLESGQVGHRFVAQRLGIYSAGAHLGYFVNLFQAAFPQAESGRADAWVKSFAQFKNIVAMPKGDSAQLTRDEFDIIAEWFARGLPNLNQVVPEEAVSSTCTPSITPSLTSYIDNAKLKGWSALNRENGMTMFGCSGSDPRQCLTTFPDTRSVGYAQTWNALPGSTLRVLREHDFQTYYWMRSSPDGRFVANGGGRQGRSTISDLATGKDIKVEAAYDPGFYPDGKGFIYQSTPIGTGFCSNSLLTSEPTAINFSEAQCRTAGGIGLYQHLATALGGGDYFVINAPFTSDNLSSRTKDPATGFSKNSELKLTPMTYNGTHFAGKDPVVVSAPYQGDAVLSPSAGLVISRVTGPNSTQLAYAVSRVNARPTAGGYNLSLTEVGRFCTSGSKAAISFDERFAVYHHYIGDGDARELGFDSAEDPRFADYRSKGGSNIYLLDMKTGAKRRITNMGPGQFAVFPHFRSDGWFYFQVRDQNKTPRQDYAMASDAALTMM